MVADNDNNLWLNTYAGIVSLNPTTKKMLRYTTTNGVYELEGNRFSTYKDDKGNIFMGSLKGLSFFNPADLDKKDIDVQPEFTSISFFNSKEDRWEINTSPSFLKNTKEITLPSEYRRFSTTISVFGEANPQNVIYRCRLLSNESNADWFTSYPGKELLFANLAAGDYVLQIEALDASNTKIGETIELRVISEDFFYKSWWFIGLLVLVTIAIFSYVSYQYKVKQSLYAKNEISSNEAKMKSAMMLETHHRIKNNLQIVSGLLGLQMADSDNEELILKLQDSQSRVESIAGIHNLLYNSENLDVIGVKENVENIIAYYKSLFPTDVTYHLNIDSTILSIDEITPLSLLLNELINNSIKHAFEKTEHPEIFIEFKKNGADYLFKYHDNGNFKKREDRKESMGMNIIEMMGNQLKGELMMENATNFKLTLVFPST